MNPIKARTNMPLEYIELKKGGVYHTQYSLGELVFLKHDPDQNERMVTGMTIRTSGIVYELSCGTSTTWHHEIELSEDKDIIKSTTN